MSDLDRRRFFVATAGLLAVRTDMARRAAPPAPRHAELYLYTRPLLRPRHEEIVRLALRRRADAHTSGWERHDGKPVLAVGPVRSGAAHWKGETMVKPMDRAWPFAAVLEYDGRGKPVAYVDWFRRARGNLSPGAWMLDPNLGYVDHINAELTCHRDERFSYLGLVDTPTGSHVGGSELVIRARVDWADGSSVRRGWWIWFDAPNDQRVEAWAAPQVPLVDWRVTRESEALGIVVTAPVEDRERELSPWGTTTVFRFPAIPPGLVPCRGDG